ncbi:ATP-binding protein [Rhodoplanes sp.]|uniref:hybrid sensor histidine kinase/response regulator n=1 Tax=Rhodoplanes sp. TaxID=1968906 RepID=UPI0025DC7C42|nr:ATP-binding protein [Rhodoplanes sp.]
MSETPRALLVDDAEIEYLTFERMLRRVTGPTRALDWARSYAEGLAAIARGGHDIYFVDIRLGPDSGLGLIREARRRGVLKPMIVLTGYGSDEVDRAATEAGANDYLVKGEFDHVLLERTIRYAERNARDLAELDRRLAESEAAARELTEQRERRALAEAELSEVLRRTVDEQESERQRVARELHDSFGQSLTLLQLGLDSVTRGLAAGTDIRQEIASLKDLTVRISEEVNHLAWELRPTALDDLGLQEAIRQVPAEWQSRCDLAFELHLALDRRLPPGVDSALYRVLQEAITNIVRHAAATRVGIILDSTPDGVRMIVEDDGCGFAADDAGRAEPPARRLGLLGIRERLSLVGGALEIESSPGRGTTLFARVPL